MSSGNESTRGRARPKPVGQTDSYQGYFLVGVLALLSLHTSLAQSGKLDTEIKPAFIDWILVIDTSLSMEGKAPGARKIFPQVKDSIKRVIGWAKNGDTITLYRFDSKVVELQDRQAISNVSDKENLKRIIDIIEAKGFFTHTGEAVKQALDLKENLRNHPDSANRAVIVVLFTDGQEDVRDMGRKPFRLSDVPISLISKGDPYVYLVWLGGEPIDDQLSKFLDRIDPNRRKVITANSDDEIAKIDEQIRKTAPLTPPIELQFTSGVHDIDFGEIEPGAITPAKSILLNSNLDARALVSVDGPNERQIVLAEPVGATDLKAGGNKIGVRLRAPMSAKDGEDMIRLVFAPQLEDSGLTMTPAMINAHFKVYHVSFLKRALKWLGLLLTIVFLALVGLILYRRQFPSEIWREFKDRNHLDGELEIVRPRGGSPDGPAILLQQYRTERLRLGQLLPAEAAGDSDAELVTVSKKGEKLVQLRHIHGSVKVNRIDIASQEIYDGDEIEIGAVLLRFNSIHERPLDEINEEA
jgi:hypothetical protein